MQKLSLRQKSIIFHQHIHHNRADMDKSQVAISEEQAQTQIKHADSVKEDVRGNNVPLQTELLKSKCEVNLNPVPPTAQSELSQIDQVENLIEQLWRELVFLRSQVSFPINFIPGIAFLLSLCLTSLKKFCKY